MRHSGFNIGLVAIAVMPATMSSASALDLTIQPRVTIGAQYYEYNVAGASDVNAEVDYVFGGLGVTGQIGSFFVDLYGQTNLTEGEDDNPNIGGGRETTVDRSEINLTAGFAATRNITLFGGLKYARNEIDSEFGNGVTIDIETDYFGPFGGLALTFPFSDVGALSLNGSVAYLDGEETVDNSLLVSDVVNDGNALGYAVGLGWSGRFGPATSALGYGIGIDYSTYDFEESGDDEFKEETARLRGEVKYRF
ncbi:MAG: hypothetical protein ACR2QF_08370 [Geminicoccaceae bacterium]